MRQTKIISADILNTFPQVDEAEVEKMLQEEVKKNDKKIVVLDDGKIAAVGTHEELLATNAIYQEVYQSQNRTGLEEGGVA